MAQRPPEFIRIGRHTLSRRQFFEGGGIFVLGVGAGVIGTILIKTLVDNNEAAQEVVPASEIVRGSLLGSYDETGKLITNSLVPGTHLIMVVRQVPAPNFAVRSVQGTGAFKDFEKPFPTFATLEQPNFASNYLMIANLDALQGGVPHNTPFQISYNVNFAAPTGQSGTKINNPGPIQYTRV